MELSHGLPHIAAVDEATGRRYGSAWVLVRLHTEPLGAVELPLGDGGITAAELARALWPAVRAAVAERCTDAREAPPSRLPPDGLRLAALSPYLRGRAAVLAAAPPISVIVCTRDRASRLPGCLTALEGQEYPSYEVIVVDNAPTTDALARLVRERRFPVPLRRVVEPRPGLSWARNAGLRAAEGSLVCYLDDDEIPDRYWLAEMARGFRAAPHVAGAGGMILPVALDSQAQRWFEEFGGHSKGRGFRQAVFDVDSHRRQHPLYPLPPFGAGGNMAFDRDVLTALGGFDVGMGAGTPTRGAEDTAAICDLMLAGHTFVYRPSALVRHRHYEGMGDLARQLHGYGEGVGAFYTRALLRDPRRLAVLMRLAPTALRDLFGATSVRTASMSSAYPPELTRAQRRGMLAGPAAYLRSRRVQRRLRDVS
ncbi:MAG: glycosyltransferase [Streptosporangiaceae bacterium]